MILARFSFTTAIVSTLILLFSFYVPRTEGQMVQACGKNLRELLALVCQSRYYGPNHGRDLNDLYDYPESSEEEHVKSTNFLNKLFLGRTPDGYDSEMPRYRATKGVADDCCQKPCSIETLQRYCL